MIVSGKRLRISTIAVTTAIVAWGLAGLAPVQAGLIGKQMDAVYYYPDTSSSYTMASFTPPSFIVGSGQETDGDVEGVTHLLVDFSDSALAITLTTTLSSPTWGTAAFNGIIFTSPGPLGILNAVVDPATTMAGFDNSRISFSSDQILVNWNGLSYQDGTMVAINFAVPEAAPAPLIGRGIPVVLAISGVLFGANLLGRSKKSRLLRTAIPHPAA